LQLPFFVSQAAHYIKKLGTTAAFIRDNQTCLNSKQDTKNNKDKK